jgi:hypothetical protein
MGLRNGMDIAAMADTNGQEQLMQISPEKIVLLAKRLHIEELNRLHDVTQVVEAVGKLIHELQAERGASSIYLASGGMQFAETRHHLVTESQAVEQAFRETVDSQVELASFGKARFLYLMAWVLIGLDELPALRGRIAQRDLAPEDCVVAYSRLIASLISLIFEVADSAVDPRTSYLLVAFFNLVQAKEFAGQERAIGGLSFSSGKCDAANRSRLTYLIDAQDRHFQIFEQFADAESLAQWRTIVHAPCVVQLEPMRRMLCGGGTEKNLSGRWFEVCSERLSAIWALQCAVVQRLKAQCAVLVADAQSELLDSEGLLNELRTNPPAKAALAGRIFDSSIPVENVLRFQFQAGGEALQGQSVIDVLDVQSQRLISMETELSAARRALEDRKAIERAKGILMARFNLTEHDAYKRMRTTSMEQNKRLVDVAEAILTLASFA